MTTSHHSGSCLCGDIILKAAGAPVSIYSDYKIEAMTFSAPNLTLYDSSNGVVRGFCSRCGSTIFYQGKNLPDMIHIHTGAFDDPECFIPKHHKNTASKLPWLSVSVQE